MQRQAPHKVRQKLLAFATAVALMLSLVIVVAWARSYWRDDTVELTLNHRLMTFGTGTGYAGFTFYGFWAGGRLELKYESSGIAPDDVALYWPRVYMYRQAYGRDFHAYLPFWLLLMMTVPLPARWMLMTWRQRRRLARGVCAACGYDLRATPERCPECGAFAANAAAA